MFKFIVLFFLPLLLAAQDHLLLTEVMIPPDGDRQNGFIEIYNPSNAATDLSDYYLANYNTYYRLVEGVYSTNSIHFLCRFPNMSLEAHSALVVALDGAAYDTVYSKKADLEIVASDDQIPDMLTVQTGGNPTLEFAKGMVILFYWDGSSDLVKDVDYLPWGISIFKSYWMDKTGVSIDGPDVGSDSSSYAADLATASQKAQQAGPDGKSLQRQGIAEADEIQSGGNGISGHNEASENWQSNFEARTPTPGAFSPVAGDGTGTVTLSPDFVKADEQANLTLHFVGTAPYTITSVDVDVPEQISWAQSAGGLQLSGAFAGATVTVAGQKITLSGMALTDQNSGDMAIMDAHMPAEGGDYEFGVFTAVDGGYLTPIASYPVLHVSKTLTIAEIQNNEAEYEGKQVEIEAVVSVGAGITRTDRTDAYVQDKSGRGININDSKTGYTELVRGNRLKITGTVHDYVGTKGDITTQIQNFTLQVLDTAQAIPGVAKLSAAAAANIALEGTMVKTVGIIAEIVNNLGGGTNITINDGTGDLALRIWDTSGLDLSDYNVGDTITVRGVIGSYKKSPQLIIAYQEDIEHFQFEGTPVTLNVENKPFVPQRDEAMNITFGAGSQNTYITLRIFDLAGRVVATLMDTKGAPFTNVILWYGKDQLGEWVPVGTYICHLEVVNNETGKRVQKIAPIVVGTVLK